MIYRIAIPRQAQKDQERLPKKVKVKVISAFIEIAKNPYKGKKLHGKRNDSYSLRVWPYRIIYFIREDDKTVIISQIQHRQGVYKYTKDFD